MSEDYQEMFEEETREQIEKMNENLLKLEEEPGDIDIIEEIYRASHTLKGMAGTMGYGGIQKISHRMEELFDKLKETEGTVGEELFDLMFECVDTIEILASGEEEEYEYLVEKLNDAIEGGGITKDKDGSSSGLEEKKEVDYPEPVLDFLKDNEEDELYLAIINVSEEEKIPSARALEVKEKIDLDIELFYPEPEDADPDQNQFYILTDEETDQEELDKTAGLNISVSEGKGKELLEVEKKEKEEDTKDKKEEKTEKDDEEQKKKKDGIKTSDKIKVDLDDIENVMNLISELVISKGTLQDLASSSKSDRLSNLASRIDRISGELREDVLDMKMTEVKTVFRRFPRMVRDLAKENDKKVDFEMEGEDIELDRTVLDRITDPLVHLLRNAIDHGIEPVDERKEKGKSPKGQIKLAATQKEENVVIEVSDDGRGLDKKKIKEKAIEQELINREEAEELSDEELYMFILHSHFSTKDEVTKVSGRGVGMEVVKNTMDSLGGDVNIESEIDEGTTIRLTLPPSVAIVRSFLVKVGNRTYAIPLDDIVETANIKKDSIEKIKGNDFIQLRDKYLPLVYLEDQFDQVTSSDIARDELTTIIVSKEGETAGLVIDEVLSEKEIVIKPLPKHLQGVGGFMGATILGDGTIAMILDTLYWIENSS